MIHFSFHLQLTQTAWKLNLDWMLKIHGNQLFLWLLELCQNSEFSQEAVWLRHRWAVKFVYNCSQEWKRESKVSGYLLSNQPRKCYELERGSWRQTDKPHNILWFSIPTANHMYSGSMFVIDCLLILTHMRNLYLPTLFIQSTLSSPSILRITVSPTMEPW